MPRKRRVIIPDIAHHVVQRGNNKQIVFEEEKDFVNYCFWVNKYANLCKVSILAYCLMRNHVHFIVIPDDLKGMAYLFRIVHMRYAQYLHRKRKTCGHIWQGRFFSCALDDDHLYYALRYVEQNPVRAGLMRYPWDYPWSSANWHIGNSTHRYIKLNSSSIVNRADWKKYLLNTDRRIDEQLRSKTYKGFAFANDNFIKHWENKLNCQLKESTRGRRPRVPEIGLRPQL